MSRAGRSGGCVALACETWRVSIFHNNERIFEQANNYLVTFAFDIFVIRIQSIYLYVWLCLYVLYAGSMSEKLKTKCLLTFAQTK